LKAIAASKPKLIIPCDDLAAVLLTKLYRRLLARNSDEDIIQVLELSIGGPSTQSARCSRTELMELAVAEGIRTAETAVVGSVDELREWTTKMGLPCALKADGTSGGVGVKIVSSFGEAESAFRKLAAPPLILRAVKRAIVDLDTNLVVPCLRRQTSAVSIQRFVGGRETTCTIASWKGNVLANLSFEVLQTWEARGPASVLRAIVNLEMSSAAESIARRLNLSGIYGFDFVMDETTGLSYLIEMNARATQTSHLALGPKRDLAAAISAAISGTPISNRPKVTENDVIVIFPVEWKKDPASPFLSSGYHDVPWSEPGLVKGAILDKSPKWVASLSRRIGLAVDPQPIPRPQERLSP
jgi:formate-dependent phosphoribosylglycinamide formyltransferase (GAR transformylase)